MKISMSRIVGAFRSGAEVYYALFERVTGPAGAHSHEQCVAFGTLSQVVAWIFATASECETGLLRMTQGEVSPEVYIASWQEAMAHPVFLFSQPVILDASSSGATIKTSSSVWYYGNQLPRALEKLRQHGCDTAAERVEHGGTVVMDLHQDAKVVAALFGYDPRWRAVAPDQIVCPLHGVRKVPGLAPRISGIRRRAPKMALHRVPGTNRLVLECDQVLAPRTGSSQQHPVKRQALFGSRDEIVSGFLHGVAAVCELRWKGGGIDAMTALRGLLASSIPELGAGFGALVSGQAVDGMFLYQQRLIGLIGNLSPYFLPGGCFAFSMDAAVKEGLAGELMDFPSFALDLVSPERMARFERLRMQRRVSRRTRQLVAV